jgi:hypothetical protein
MQKKKKQTRQTHGVGGRSDAATRRSGRCSGAQARQASARWHDVTY